MVLVRRLASSPWSYAVWAVMVVAALGVTYAIDPYLYAFTAIGLFWLGCVVTPLGLGVALFARSLPRARRVAMAGAVLIAAGALAFAFALLRTFSWA